MKNIKFFKYKNTREFERFLSAHGVRMEDVKGQEFRWKEQCNGNFLKVYVIHFNEPEVGFFNVAYFKSWNECNQARLGLKGDKLLEWYEYANVRFYKATDTDEYVIER